MDDDSSFCRIGLAGPFAFGNRSEEAQGRCLAAGPVVRRSMQRRGQSPRVARLLELIGRARGIGSAMDRHFD
jgi:hypothetical protein